MDFVHNWRKHVKVPRTLSEARNVAGSARYKKVKQYDIVLSFKVSLTS